MLSGDGSEYLIRATSNGSVKLFYDNAKKLETTSTGVDVTGTVTADGLTVEGSTAPTINIKSTDAVVVADDVVGAITFEESDATGGTGVQAFIKAIANDSGNTYDMSIGVGGNTEAIRVDQSGNVGIGTSSPGYPLELAVGVGTTAQRISRGGNYIDFGGLSSGTVYMKGYEGRVEVGNAYTGPLDLITGDTAKVTITNGGSVGIGTTNPLRQLTVSNSGAALLLLESTGNDNGQLLFGDAASDTVGKVLYRHSDNRMSFQTNGSEHVHIDNVGNVGIRTTSPQGDLDVRNGTNQTLIIGNSGSYAGGEYGRLLFKESSTELSYVQWNGTGNEFRVWNKIGGPLTLGTSNVERMRLDSLGIATITSQLSDTDNFSLILKRYNGNTSAGARQHGIGFWDQHNPTYVGAVMGYRDAPSGNYNGGLRFYVNDTGGSNAAAFSDLTLAMTLTSGGYVGIGTSTPNAKFTVNGAVVAATQTTTKSGTPSPNFDNYQNFIWTITSNITLLNPTTEKVGQTGFFIFIHSGAGRTVSLGTDYETVGGAGLTLSSTNGAADLVPYAVLSTGRILLGTPQLAFA
jgi:hypothetical protein